MARTPITDSANIFLQGSQLYQNANSKIFDAISGAADLYARQQAQKEANLSAERMKQAELDAQKAKMMQESQKAMFTDEGLQAILAKKQMAPQTVTPQEEAALQAGIQFRQSQMGQNPVTGGLYPKFQPTFGTGFSSTAGMMAPAPMPMGGSMVAEAMLPPPRFDGGAGSTEQFAQDFKSPPAPIGTREKIVDTTGMGSTPVGRMEEFKSNLGVSAERAKKEIEFNQKKEERDTARNEFQSALDDLYAINEEMKAAGILKGSDKGRIGSIPGNLKNMAAGAVIPVPFTDGLEIGRGAESLIDPASAELRNKFETVRASALQAYKKAAGVTGGEMNTPKEYENVMKAMGSPNSFYESNLKGLESVSKRYGTGKFGGKKEDASKAGEATPKGLPEGSVKIGTSKGKPIYKTPDGKTLMAQ